MQSVEETSATDFGASSYANRRVMMSWVVRNSSLCVSLAQMETVTSRTVLDLYLERRTDVKEITKIKWRQTCNALKEFFGAEANS